MHDVENVDPAEPSRKEAKTRRNKERHALVQRLQSEDAYDLANPLDECGTPIPLTCTCCGEHRVAEQHCMRRYCPSCQPLVTAKRHARWSAALSKLQWPLFITLTIPNSEDPESLRFLRKKWGCFRRRKIIADKVRGGIATFEVTNKGQGWHPHLHAILDCQWLAIHTPAPAPTDSKAVIKQKCEFAHRELSLQWANMIDNEQAIVWAHRVYGDQAISEVLKYAAKGSDLINSPQPIAPMLRVLSSTRTLSGFGSLHPLPNPDRDTGAVCICDKCGAEKSFMPDEIIKFLCGPTSPSSEGRTVQPRNQN